MILKLMYVNPISTSIDVLNVEYPTIDYPEWRRTKDCNTDEEICRVLDNIITTLDCTKEYDCGRPMMTTFYNYTANMSNYYRYMLKLDNQVTYNNYIDKLIKRHIDNIIFEYEHPFQPKVKGKPKRNSKKRTIPNKFIKQKTIDMFTGKDVYVYDNPKTGEHIESSNPNVINELKKTKVKKKTVGVPIESMTFSFKAK